MRILACIAVLIVSAATFGQWSDNFNRANGAIGGDWTVVSGTWAVENNQGRHTSTSSNEIIQHNLADMTYLTAVSYLDVFAVSTASQYSALGVGLGSTDAVQIKVQAQTSTGQFSHIGMYHKTSATGWGNWTGTTTLPGGGTSTSGFVTIPAGLTFASARMKVWFPSADVVQLDLDTDFNGSVDQSYSRTGVSAFGANIGTKHGILGWGATATFDNWSVVPEPAALALLALGALLRRR
ncbi:MAG: hypothetical protein AB1716_07445 [Planctomycetota bacterium]